MDKNNWLSYIGRQKKIVIVPQWLGLKSAAALPYFSRIPDAYVWIFAASCKLQ